MPCPRGSASLPRSSLILLLLLLLLFLLFLILIFLLILLGQSLWTLFFGLLGSLLYHRSNPQLKSP